MKPSTVASKFRLLAAEIDNSRAPSQSKIAGEVRGILASFHQASGGIKESDRLAEIISTRVNAAYMDADGSCTAGSDNDGSTGFEIFENGFDLAVKSAGRPVFSAYNEDAGAFFFVIASSEAEACSIASAWDED